MPAERDAKLAAEFKLCLYRIVSNLKGDLGAVAALREVDKLNRQEKDNICHSHDVCDANVAMWDAFKNVVGREMVPNDAGDDALVAAAWDKAKVEGFAPNLPGLPRTRLNSKCPCGSGKKFKKCCGNVVVRVADPVPEGKRPSGKRPSPYMMALVAMATNFMGNKR